MVARNSARQQTLSFSIELAAFTSMEACQRPDLGLHLSTRSRDQVPLLAVAQPHQAGWTLVSPLGGSWGPLQYPVAPGALVAALPSSSAGVLCHLMKTCFPTIVPSHIVLLQVCLSGPNLLICLKQHGFNQCCSYPFYPNTHRISGF